MNDFFAGQRFLTCVLNLRPSWWFATHKVFTVGQSVVFKLIINENYGFSKKMLGIGTGRNTKITPKKKHSQTKKYMGML